MTNDRFDLSVFRDTTDRIKMIQDPECPLEVFRVVAEFDQDQEVLVELYLSQFGRVGVERVERACLGCLYGNGFLF